MALRCGYVWDALGLSFVSFLLVGTLLVCTPALRCSGVGLIFLRGTHLPEVFRGLAPFCWVVAVLTSPLWFGVWALLLPEASFVLTVGTSTS